ncbi:cobyric acid synthase [Verrucomicrobiota bacterium]
MAKCIAFLGTGSDVGKSITVTAVCRILKKRGFNVAPYKAQNMSNNSYVTLEGGEMGRAQIVQAEAAGIEPHTDMNPVLLKPNSDRGSQIVLQGKVHGNTHAADYFKDTSFLFEKSNESLARLRDKHEVVVMEGAGSCGEVNLRSRDFVNFESAHAADAPVILVADIDKGGVFAQLIGTLEVIPEKDRQRVAGFLINKFRGDPALFEDGIKYLEEKSGLPALGLIPCFTDIEIDSEDGMPLETVIDPPDRPQRDKINVAVIRLPHISNFTDFAPLQRDPAVRMHYLRKPRSLEGYDAVCLPGTKSTCADLQWLKDKGWAARIQDYAGNGGRVLGVCGGYQMLGKEVTDPEGIEGEPGAAEGLNLLDIRTTLASDKLLSRTQGTLIGKDVSIDGYEIHMGTTTLGPNAVPLVQLNARNRKTVNQLEGAANPSETVWGTYFHGLFDFPAFHNHFLQTIDPQYSPEDPKETARFKQEQYDLLADHFEKHMDIDKLLEIIHGGTTSASSIASLSRGTGSTPSHDGRMTNLERGQGGTCPSNETSGKLASRKQPIHLPPVERFNSSTIIFLTVCTKDRQPLLDNKQMHQLLRQAWEQADGWRVGKYIIMPDHIHLFCSPAKRNISLEAWVKYWKSLVIRSAKGFGAEAYGRGGTRPSNGRSGSCPSKHFFQRDFWDTQLRNGKCYSEKWEYVRANPVRAGLVDDAIKWVYQGEMNVLFWHGN